MGVDYVYRKKHVRLAMRLYDLLGSVFRKRRSPKLQGPPKHVCFVVLHQIGDVVMALPTVKAVMGTAPNARLSALVGTATAPIFRLGAGDAVEVYEFDAAWQYAVESAGSASTARARFVELMAKVSPDAVVVFHPDLVVNQLLGKGKFETFGFTNAGGGFLLRHPVDMPTQGHQVERNYALAKEFGKAFGVEIPPLQPPRLSLDFMAAQAADRLAPSGDYAVIHPFGRFNSRNWDLKRWTEIIAALHEQDLKVAVIGGKSDNAQPFVNAEAIDLTGKLELAETAAIIAQARLFIGIDSGPGHIAAAVGTPVISIFSSANVPERWAPYGDNVKVLYSPDIDRAKWPLEARDLPGGTVGNPYTDKITVEQVIDAIEEMRRR